jgi:hypothetical protein
LLHLASSFWGKMPPVHDKRKFRRLAREGLLDAPAIVFDDISSKLKEIPNDTPPFIPHLRSIFLEEQLLYKQEEKLQKLGLIVLSWADWAAKSLPLEINQSIDEARNYEILTHSIISLLFHPKSEPILQVLLQILKQLPTNFYEEEIIKHTKDLLVKLNQSASQMDIYLVEVLCCSIPLTQTLFSEHTADLLLYLSRVTQIYADQFDQETSKGSLEKESTECESVLRSLLKILHLQNFWYLEHQNVTKVNLFQALSRNILRILSSKLCLKESVHAASLCFGEMVVLCSKTQTSAPDHGYSGIIEALGNLFFGHGDSNFDYESSFLYPWIHYDVLQHFSTFPPLSRVFVYQAFLICLDDGILLNPFKE